MGGMAGGGHFAGPVGGGVHSGAAIQSGAFRSSAAVNNRFVVNNRFAVQNRFAANRFAFRHHFPFRHRFVRDRFAFASFAFAGSDCFVIRRVWTPWGWSWRRIWVCD
jgi:hypothetical protein